MNNCGIRWGRFGRIPALQGNNHSLRLAPCIHPEYAATYATVIH